MVLYLVAAVQTVLQKMERHAEVLQTKLICEAKFSKAKEVLVEIFGEITADELLAAVVEGACAVRTCMIAQGGSLVTSQYLLHD